MKPLLRSTLLQRCNLTLKIEMVSKFITTAK